MVTVAARLDSAWRRRDPGLAVLRRALRVTVAASVGFLVFRYVVGDPTAATYAMFAAVGFGLFSDLVGTPAQRVRTLAWCLLGGAVLVALGTLAAVDDVVAALGMLLLGPMVAFLGTGGPRAAGVALGLHLLYILPSFPPYAPDTLPSRWAGLALGVVLLAVAERWLWPADPPRPFTDRIVVASRAVAADLRGGASSRAAAEDLRLRRVPWEERPTGPGARDRLQRRLASALRAMHGRAEALRALEDGPDAAPTAGAARDAVARSLDGVADALERRTDPPPDADLVATRDAIDEQRVARLRSGTPPAPDVWLARAQDALLDVEIVEQQRVVRTATALLVDPPARTRRGASPHDGAWWYADAAPATLWWARVRTDLTLRSVQAQNAVRVGVGLAVARLVAGGLDLSHGFWVLLATLTLMRTSVSTTGAGLPKAVGGTAAGAVLAAGLLTVMGPHTVVAAVLLPVLVLVATVAGRLVGVVAGQAAFTLLVSVLFAQLAPAGWTLDAARLVDVVVGGAVGLAVGALVWPRGAGGAVDRDAASTLEAAADVVVAVVGWLAGRVGREDVREPLRRLVTLQDRLDGSVAQYAAERRRDDDPGTDWLALVAVVHRTVDGARAALAAHEADTGASAGPDTDATDHLRAGAAQVAEAYRAVARSLIHPERAGTGVAAPGLRAGLQALAPARRSRPAAVVLREVDAWGWLAWLADDLAVLRRVRPTADAAAAPGDR